MLKEEKITRLLGSYEKLWSPVAKSDTTQPKKKKTKKTVA